jgi:hypothetical protein
MITKYAENLSMKRNLYIYKKPNFKSKKYITLGVSYMENNKMFIGEVIETAKKKYLLPFTIIAAIIATSATVDLSQAQTAVPQTAAQVEDEDDSGGGAAAVLAWGIAELTKRAANEAMKSHSNPTKSAVQPANTEPVKKSEPAKVTAQPTKTEPAKKSEPAKVTAQPTKTEPAKKSESAKVTAQPVKTADKPATAVKPAEPVKTTDAAKTTTEPVKTTNAAKTAAQPVKTTNPTKTAAKPAGVNIPGEPVPKIFSEEEIRKEGISPRLVRTVPNNDLRNAFSMYDPKLSNVSQAKLDQYKKFYMNFAVRTTYKSGSVRTVADWQERRKAGVAKCEDCSIILSNELDKIGINNWRVIIENKPPKGKSQYDILRANEIAKQQGKPPPYETNLHAFNAFEINKKIYYVDLTGNLIGDQNYDLNHPNVIAHLTAGQRPKTASEVMPHIKSLGYTNPQFSFMYVYKHPLETNLMEAGIIKKKPHGSIGADLFDTMHKLTTRYGKEKAFDIIENRELVARQEEYLSRKREKEEREAKNKKPSSRKPTQDSTLTTDLELEQLPKK